MSHRFPVNGCRCLSDTLTLQRRKTRPERVFPVTASVTTLFHNIHAKYRKYTDSRRLYTTAHPTYVPSTSGQRQSMPLKHRTVTLQRRKTRPEIVFPVNASVTTLFDNRHAKYRKHTESRRLSTIAHPPYVLSSSGQIQSMPLRHRNPVTPECQTTNSIPRHRKRHNTFR
jgi:hypothetical protein